MTDRTANIIRLAIGWYFVVLATGSLVLFFFILLTTPDLINRWEVVAFNCFGPLFLALLLAGIAYGVSRSRRWVVWFHGIVLTVWLVLTSALVYGVMADVWRGRNLDWLVIILVVFVVPISIQVFLIRYRKRLFVRGQRWGFWEKVAIALVGLMGLPITMTIAFAAFIIVAAGPAERRPLATTENERHKVTACYYPGIWVTDMPSIKVVHVDKDSWLKGESTVWAARDHLVPDTVSLSLVTPDSLRIVTYRRDAGGRVEGEYKPIDTILVDLLEESSYPTAQPVADVSPRWHSEIDYEGCVDVDTVENEHYRVIHRTYPSIPGEYRGAARLLLVDKHEWFEDEKILAETMMEDSISIRFVDGNSMAVMLYKNDPCWLQYRELGKVDTKIYHLDLFDGSAYRYCDDFGSRAFPYIEDR